MCVCVKAAILQRAVDYIDELQRQKQLLVIKNARLMHQLLSSSTGNTNSSPEMTSWLPAKRRRLDSMSSSDEGVATVDTPTFGSRRLKPELDETEEAERKLYDGAEDLRIASLPVTTATLPVAAQVPRPPVGISYHGSSFSRISQLAPICTLSSTRFLGPTQSVAANCISIGSAVFARLTQTDRQTDRDTDRPSNVNISVAITRPHLGLMLAMQPPKIQNSTERC